MSSARISPSIDDWTGPDMNSFFSPPSSALSEKLTSVPVPLGAKRNSPFGRAGPATTWNA